MDFEGWECRNLARSLLSRVYKEAVTRYTYRSDSESPPRSTREFPLKRRYSRDTMSRIAHYRRFDRDDESTKSSANQDENRGEEYEKDHPFYRRFSRHLPVIDPYHIEWPFSTSITPQMGKKKIIEFIEKKWSFNSRIHYTIEFLCIVHLHGIDRYKYCSRWSNGYFSSRVYFNVDASTVDPMAQVIMTFSLPDGKRAHRPTTSNDHFDKFMRRLDFRGKL